MRCHHHKVVRGGFYMIKEKLEEWLSSVAPGARNLVITSELDHYGHEFSNEILLVDMEWDGENGREEKAVVLRTPRRAAGSSLRTTFRSSSISCAHWPVPTFLCLQRSGWMNKESQSVGRVWLWRRCLASRSTSSRQRRSIWPTRSNSVRWRPAWSRCSRRFTLWTTRHAVSGSSGTARTR